MLSTLYANKVLDKVFRDTAVALGPWLSLHTTDPGATGAGELAGVVRQSILTSFATPASNGQLLNTVAVVFNNPPNGTVNYLGVWDAQTGGNFVQGGPLSQSVTTSSSSAFLVSAGMLVLQFIDTPQLTNFTTLLRNQILDNLYRQINFRTAPVCASLHLATPGQTGASEVSGGGYVRQPVGTNAAAGGSEANSGNVTYTNLPQCDVSYVGGFDQTTGGNFLMGAQMLVNGVPGVASIPAGNALIFQPGFYSTSLT